MIVMSWCCSVSFVSCLDCCWVWWLLSFYWFDFYCSLRQCLSHWAKCLEESVNPGQVSSTCCLNSTVFAFWLMMMAWWELCWSPQNTQVLDWPPSYLLWDSISHSYSGLFETTFQQFSAFYLKSWSLVFGLDQISKPWIVTEKLLLTPLMEFSASYPLSKV